MRRLLALSATGTVILLLASLPALAAMPAFEWVVGAQVDAIEVTITFEPVPSGFAWPSLEESGALGELVGAVPSDEVDQAGRPIPGADPILFDLERIETGIYGATAETGPGKWAVVVWPMTGEFPVPQPGIPETTFVTVTTSPSSPVLPWALLVVGSGVVGAVWLSRRRQTVDA